MTEICVHGTKFKYSRVFIFVGAWVSLSEKKNMAASAGESTDVIRQNGYYQGDQEHAFFNVHL